MGSGFYNWSRPRDLDAKFACLVHEVRADFFLKTACAAYEPGAPDKDDGLKDHCWNASSILSLSD